jgi:hypothetical protein
VTTTTPATCNLRSLSSSPAVTAFSTVKQSTFGCFHPEAAGVLPQDVHVIDLKTSELSHSRRRRDTSAPRVEVDLVPSSGDNLRFAHLCHIFISSVADPGCLSLNRLFPSRIRFFSIPDPGSASKNLSILTQKIDF